MIKDGDFILVTEKEDEKYLQVGEVINSEHDYDGCIIKYEVEFGKDDIKTYDWELPDMCKVLMFERK